MGIWNLNSGANLLEVFGDVRSVLSISFSVGPEKTDTHLLFNQNGSRQLKSYQCGQVYF